MAKNLVAYGMEIQLMRKLIFNIPTEIFTMVQHKSSRNMEKDLCFSKMEQNTLDNLKKEKLQVMVHISVNKAYKQKVFGKTEN